MHSRILKHLGGLKSRQSNLALLMLRDFVGNRGDGAGGFVTAAIINLSRVSGMVVVVDKKEETCQANKHTVSRIRSYITNIFSNSVFTNNDACAAFIP